MVNKQEEKGTLDKRVKLQINLNEQEEDVAKKLNHSRRSKVSSSTGKKDEFSTEGPGLVLSGRRLMTVITMMRCFLRP